MLLLTPDGDTKGSGALVTVASTVAGDSVQLCIMEYRTRHPDLVNGVRGAEQHARTVD